MVGDLVQENLHPRLPDLVFQGKPAEKLEIQVSKGYFPADVSLEIFNL